MCVSADMYDEDASEFNFDAKDADVHATDSWMAALTIFQKLFHASRPRTMPVSAARA